VRQARGGQQLARSTLGILCSGCGIGGRQGGHRGVLIAPGLIAPDLIGLRPVVLRPVGLRLFAPQPLKLRLLKLRLCAQGVPFAYLGDTLG
jgi:hypothetical protein